MTQSSKPVALAIGATLAGGLMLSGSAFASTQLAQGYLLGTSHGEGGKHDVTAMDTDQDGMVSRAEFAAAHDGKADKFDAIDSNQDGFIDAEEYAAHKQARHGDDEMAGGDKAGMEGKCGEGKCGGMA